MSLEVKVESVEGEAATECSEIYGVGDGIFGLGSVFFAALAVESGVGTGVKHVARDVAGP